MPDLMETWTKDNCAYEPGTTNDQGDIVLSPNELGIRPGRDHKNERFLNPHQLTYRTRSYILPTTPEHASIHQVSETRWKEEQEAGRIRREECVDKSFCSPSSAESSGQLMYDNAETESFISEHMENEPLPLTFTQAVDALNNMRLEEDRLPLPFRCHTGAKSAESLYDGDDALIDDPELNFRYEKVCEAELHEQNVLLKLMRMEQRSWEGRIENVLQYRNELENRLKLLRYKRQQAHSNSPYRSSHAQQGLPAANLPNRLQRKYSSFARHSVWPAQRMPPTEFTRWNYANRRFLTGHTQYVSGSMDSIDDLSRSPLFTPEEMEKPSVHLRSVFHHHHIHNPYGMQRTESEPEELPFSLNNERFPRCGFVKVANNRYSMFETPLTDASLASPLRHEGHSKQWSPHSPNLSPEMKQPNQHRRAKSVYVNSFRKYPQTTVLPHLSNPPKDSYDSSEQAAEETSEISLEALEDMGMNYGESSGRSENRRQLLEADKQRHHSHGPASVEKNEHNVRRRQCIHQAQELRENRPRRFIVPQEMDNMELFSEPEYLVGDNASPVTQHRQLSSNKSQAYDPMQPECSGANRFRSSSSSRNHVDSGMREQHPSSPKMRSNMPVPTSIIHSIFDPLVEYSEEDVESVRTTTPTNDHSENRSQIIHAAAPIRLKASPHPDDSQQNRLPSNSFTHPADSKERETKNEKSIDDSSSGQLKRIPLLIVVSSANDFPEDGQITEKDHCAAASAQNVSQGSFMYLANEVISSDSTKYVPSQTNPLSVAPKSLPQEKNSSLCCQDDTGGTQKISGDVISVNDPVRLICLGPLDGHGVEYHYLTQQVGDPVKPPSTRPPTWIGLCFGDSNVSVYELKTHRCIIECRDHNQQSQSPVLVLLPFVSQGASISGASESSNTTIHGLLCVVQEDGTMTVYNLANQRVSGQMTLKQKINYSVLLPQPRLIQNCLTQLVFAVTDIGSLICIQWNLTGYLKEEDGLRHPQWEAEIHELGINIFDRLGDNNCKIPYVCCVSPHQQSGSTPDVRACSPLSPSANGRELPIRHFSFLAASLNNENKKSFTTVRLCRWIPRRSQLKLALCVDKTLHCEPDSALIGITYAEIGGAPSICLCLSYNVFWFSFRSADLVSSMKIPTCVQPATLLPSIWPYKYFGSYSKTNLNERLWAAMSGRHLLELSAFDSQRRRDSRGRGSLALRYVYPSDSIITALVSTFYEEEVVIVGTNKGQVHFIPVTTDFYVCQVPNCVLGFCSKDDLVFHIVRDHYSVECPTTPGAIAVCTWPGCDQVIKSLQERMNDAHVEKHAMQHACEP